MKINRRKFIKASSAFIGVGILPSHVWANSPNGKVSIAQVGVGGQGGRDLGQIASHPMCQVVGLCEVDRGILSSASSKYPDAKTYADYRVMLDELGDKIDAISVGTPDHMHAPISLMAMEMGKHVFCEKPLAHNIAECYQMARVANAHKELHTQMGVQIHSGNFYRMATDFLRQGAIGKVSKVYVWSNKSWGHDDGPFSDSDPAPENLDWNLWLGVAPEHSYARGKYHPGEWRRLIDFGCGTLGDMGVHIFDTPIHALKLGFAESVKTTCRKPDGFGHPTENIVEFQFAGTEYTTDKVSFTWLDGRHAPPSAEDNPDVELPDGGKLPDQGAMFIGEDGKRMLLPHVSAPQFLPGSLLENVTRPDLPQIDHYHLWIDAILGKGKCNVPFDYAGRMSANVLLGIVGSHFPEQTLNWDGTEMRFTNNDAANAMVSREYREF